MRSFVKEAGGYAAASVCALTVDVAILTALVQFGRWLYLPAACVSFTAGAVVAYFISIRFVFRHRRIENRRSEFLRFTALGALGLCVNAVIMSAAIRVGGLHYLPAKFVAAGGTFACNFFSRRQLLFAPPLKT